MNPTKINQLVEETEKEAVKFLSSLIKAGAETGGTSGKEGKRAQLLQQNFEKITKQTHVDDFGNIIGGVGALENYEKTIWFIGHIDTVGSGEWKNAYQPQIKDNKIYGRGASDQLAGVVSQTMALKILKKNEQKLKQQKTRILVMGNPHEEDIEGESIKYLLKQVTKKNSKLPKWLKNKPELIVTTEPTSTEEGMPRPYFGHRGRYLYKLKVKGETGHASIPVDVPAAEVFSRTIANVFKTIQEPISKKFGKDTYAFTTGKLTSPSFNAHTEVAQWNIDFRIAPVSQPTNILNQMRKAAQKTRKKIAQEKELSIENIPEVNMEIVNQKLTTYNQFTATSPQRLPGPWLPIEHPLREKALKIYQNLFGKKPPFDQINSDLTPGKEIDPIEGDYAIRDFYNFSTDLTAIAQLKRKSEKENQQPPEISYMGLGPGIEEQAHRKKEWCPISSLKRATAYYVALSLKF